MQSALSNPTRSKEWARECYKGVEGSTKASYTPDFRDIDEEGVRHDVRQSIRHGFFSTMCSGTGLELNERKRLVQIVCEESGGRLLVGVNVAQPSLDESLDLLDFAGRIGCSHAFVSFPRQLSPETQDEVYAYYRRIIEATDMGIVLYAYDAPNMRRFHPSGIPVDVFDRLADFDNVIAVKLTQPMNPAVAMELCERLSDRVLVGPASLEMAMLLARHYPVQWTGQWIVEGVQSPEKPYVVELMNALACKRFDEALKIYWRLEPAYRLVHRLQQPLLLKGGHPWAHIRYFQWCVGGNGGLIRDTKHGKDQVSVLDQAGREEIRDTYRRIGINPYDGPEDEFIVGRSNYARGVRPSDMTELPLYR